MTTASGNSVTIHAIRSPVLGVGDPAPGYIFVAADVEACAGPDADTKTGVSPVFFTVETNNGQYSPSTSATKPYLHDTTMSPNGCARGWITFQVPEEEKVESIMFRSSSIIEWDVES